jgi:hypothetical protein
MAHTVRFYCGARPLGSSAFGAFGPFSLRVMAESYGSDWADCLTYDVPGQPECLGAPDSDAEDARFSPDWARGLARAEALLAAVRARGETDAHVWNMIEFVELLRKCATSPFQSYCRVSIA